MNVFIMVNHFVLLFGEVLNLGSQNIESYCNCMEVHEQLQRPILCSCSQVVLSDEGVTYHVIDNFN